MRTFFFQNTVSVWDTRHFDKPVSFNKVIGEVVVCLDTIGAWKHY